MKLTQGKCQGFNDHHLTEKLKEHEQIELVVRSSAGSFAPEGRRMLRSESPSSNADARLMIHLLRCAATIARRAAFRIGCVGCGSLNIKAGMKLKSGRLEGAKSAQNGTMELLVKLVGIVLTPKNCLQY